MAPLAAGGAVSQAIVFLGRHRQGFTDRRRRLLTCRNFAQALRFGAIVFCSRCVARHMTLSTPAGCAVSRNRSCRRMMADGGKDFSYFLTKCRAMSRAPCKRLFDAARKFRVSLTTIELIQINECLRVHGQCSA